MRKFSMLLLTGIATQGGDLYAGALVEKGRISLPCLALASSDNVGTISSAQVTIRGVLDVDLTSIEQEWERKCWPALCLWHSW